MRYELVTTTYLPGRANAAAEAAAAAPHEGLAAYWVSELGTLNQTIELWSGRRPAPAGDAPLDSAVSEVTAVRGPTAPAVAGGIYEMRDYRLRPGMVPAWVEIFTAALPEREKYSRLAALLVNEADDRVIHIWGYPDLNTRVAARAAAVQDPAWKDFLGKSRGQKLTVRQHAAILLPAAHSPLG